MAPLCLRFSVTQILSQEILKVRGFQVAPAELEGHLLDHPEVDDACVVGVPDDYSGEVPFAFIMLGQSAAKRLRKDPTEAEKIRASIFKVGRNHCTRQCHFVDFVSIARRGRKGAV